MRITKIAIKDFRAFRGEYEIDLHKAGHNLLVYGENGSGKSSLFQALNLFLSTQPIEFIQHKHFRVKTDDGYVKINVGDGTNPDRTLEWGETSTPSEDSLVIEASKSKGFLDYKALLETYFLQRDSESVNLFDLLVKNLLANVENPISRRKFGEEFALIETTFSKTLNKPTKENLDNQIKDFNDGLTRLLQDLEVKVNEILALYNHNVTIKIMPQLLGYDQKPKKLKNREILLEAWYYGDKREKYHHFLNEARLSAIALSIYLSALLLNPPSQLRVLALDDVLIGLDMSNRMPLLNILDKYFQQWQIFIMTFDWTWHQIIFQRVQQNEWERVRLFICPTDNADAPVHLTKDDYLERAEIHLMNGDLRATVVYLRTGFEHIMKVFCDKKRLDVRYDIENKHTVNDYWGAIKGKKKSYVSVSLAKDLDTYLTTVLNPLSHDAYINPVRRDIDDTLKALKKLRTELNIS